MAETLLSPGFVVAVVLLLVNDGILKETFGTWWTGKLSDFAGLYAFPLFWAALLPRRRTLVFCLTAVAFVVWKSPLSEPAIVAWNALGVWPVSRVVDYTDWLALAALLPSYRSLSELPRSPHQRWALGLRRAVAAGVAGVALFAFMATSQIEVYQHVFPPGTAYQVDGERAAIRAYFLAHEWLSAEDELGASVDTLSSDYFDFVRITLHDMSPCGTRVTLVDMETSDEDEDVPAAQQKFEQEVISLLRIRFPSCS